MNIIITGNHLTVTESIKNHTTAAFSSLLENYDFIVSTNINLSKTNNKSNPHKADALLVVKGKEIFASAEGEDMYSVIESLVSKISVQLKKYKEKNKTHKGATSVKDLSTDEETF